jgi:2-oxoglutarate dehydrogenase E2 component (dihydrolipoamide succinyltransferase)
MEGSLKIFLPKLGESIVSATVVQWFKKPGDRIERDEPLLEVSTDKVNSEIPSPVAGVLAEIVAPPEKEVQVGEPLAVIATGSVEPVVVPGPAPVAAASAPGSEPQNAFLSPAVLRLLQERNIPLTEVDRIPRSGLGGRLTKQDVEAYRPTAVSAACSSPSSVEVERVKMSGIRKAIADNMVKSFYEAPHASLITEVDVTELMKVIQARKEHFFQEHGAKLTITSFAALAIARALKSYPLLNASLELDTILVKKSVHLGVAVSVDQGVMVPVIRNCQDLSLPEISKRIGELAAKAREHRLAPEDVQGGTVTMTNFGMTGTMIGIPIIRFPEVAIIGLGAVVKKVAAMPDDSIAVRSVMMVSLTFDHRVLDGLYGCGFLNEVKTQLEKGIPDR